MQICINAQNAFEMIASNENGRLPVSFWETFFFCAATVLKIEMSTKFQVVIGFEFYHACDLSEATVALKGQNNVKVQGFFFDRYLITT